MLYGEYDFVCRFEKEAVLPEYKGSTFHGVFGRALKNVVCALKRRQTCDDCPLRRRCLYVRVFETHLSANTDGAAGHLSELPHPYVIEPPETSENVFEKDRMISCRLGLFGSINQDLPFFVYAFDRMGNTGLGRRVGKSRGKFCLEQVSSGKKVVYTRESGRIDPEGCAYSLGLKHTNGCGTGRVTIRIKTPLRVKHQQRIARELPFHVLTRAMLRRVSSLMAAYGDGEPELDYRGLVKKAESVEISDAKLKWYDWQRYSFRRKKRMPMGGLVGAVTYENVPLDLLSLIDFCEKVHVGKNTSFGLGKIRRISPEGRKTVDF